MEVVQFDLTELGHQNTGFAYYLYSLKRAIDLYDSISKMKK